MIADLHLHTLRSDGSLTPASLVRNCKALNIFTIGITDHDTVSGVSEAVEAGKKCGVRVLPAIELSSFISREVHILGYNIDYLNPLFLERLDRINHRRESRNLDIIGNLKSLGMKLDYDIIRGNKPSVGRLHIARQMFERGYVSSINEAFDRYIGFGKEAYKKSPMITPQEAVSLIREFNGVPVLAHPYRIIEEMDIDMLIESLGGLMGIEVYYPLHTAEMTSRLISIALRYNLIMTGGSDFHSVTFGSPIGSGRYVMDERAREILLR